MRRGWPSFGAFFKHDGAVISSGDFRVTESPLRISITAVERILRVSESLNLNTEVPALVNSWLKQAKASLIKNWRPSWGSFAEKLHPRKSATGRV